MPKNKLTTRTYPVNLQTREEDGIGTIFGRPIVFNARTDLGWFDEIIDPRALDAADLTDVRLCLNHDTGYVYARSRRNNPNSTMRLNVNTLGMDIEADLAIKESPKAQDYFSAVSRGDISGMSFMFSIDGEEWENLESDHPLRRITKIGSVVEVSAVTFPAYGQTEIFARSSEELDSAKAALDKARELQRAKPVDTGELELLKEKAKILGGFFK